MNWDDFLEKMDWEGGIIEVLDWGGPDCFPEELREAAERLAKVFGEIERAIEEHR